MATAETSKQLLTAEQFAEMPDPGAPCELVEGEVVMSPQPSFEHGIVCGLITQIVGEHVRKNSLGTVVSNDTGVVTKRSPDTARGADVAFYSFDAVPKGERPYPYPKNPPELIFEVKSRWDRWADIDTKVAEYLAIGVRVVVVIDPETASAVIHYADRPPITLAESDTMALPEILGDFQVVLAEFLG